MHAACNAHASVRPPKDRNSQACSFVRQEGSHQDGDHQGRDTFEADGLIIASMQVVTHLWDTHQLID